MPCNIQITGTLIKLKAEQIVIRSTLNILSDYDSNRFYVIDTDGNITLNNTGDADIYPHELPDNLWCELP